MDNTKTTNKATITINGRDQEVISLIPDLSAGDQLAIVHLDVLKRLTALLPNASFSTIKQRVADDVMDTQNMHQLVSVLARELAFQETVNVISTITGKDVHPLNA